jgi:D-alanine-D-alanine ligase
MALGADKPLAKAVVAAAGVDVPDGLTVRDPAELDGRDVPLPAVVKPADGDNSDGLTLVREPGGLAAAVSRALDRSDAALVERYVELGREVRCGVLERDGGLQVLPLEEYAVDPARKPVRDAADKLARRDGELTLVAKDSEHAWTVPPDDPDVPAVAAAARAAHVALGCRHYSLFDFRIDPDGRPWFLEAGLYCSFARSSVLATMAAATGIGVPQLFAASVGQALADRQIR